MLKSTNMDFFISNISELRRANNMNSRGLASTVGRSAAGSNAGKDDSIGSMRNQEKAMTYGRKTPDIKIVMTDNDVAN